LLAHPRFVCALMAAGLFYCLLLLAGCVAAEINSPCFLCFVLASASLSLSLSLFKYPSIYTLLT
jgi:hypothetical protein